MKFTAEIWKNMIHYKEAKLLQQKVSKSFREEQEGLKGLGTSNLIKSSSVSSQCLYLVANSIQDTYVNLCINPCPLDHQWTQN